MIKKPKTASEVLHDCYNHEGLCYECKHNLEGALECVWTLIDDTFEIFVVLKLLDKLPKELA